MAYHVREYYGDVDYCINCTGDAVVGDEVRFERAKFAGSYRNAKFVGIELITGKIIKDSYGREKQQHTFTLVLADDTEIRIKGRNLYANDLYRKPWADEQARIEAQSEKHARGDAARATRTMRKENEHAFRF